MLQAVAECFCRSGKACDRVSASEMALEYFIVPETMWPAGLLCAVVYRDKLDGIAKRIMNQVKDDFTTASRQHKELQVIASDAAMFQYRVYQEPDKSLAISIRKHAKSYCYGTHYQLSTPLQNRIIALGRSLFLAVVPNNKHQPGAWESSWAFEVHMPTL